MLLEVILATELRSAVRATERLSVRVRRHVPRQRRTREERRLAEVAAELAAERVAPRVLALLLLGRERLAAHRAQVRVPEVHLHVLLHRLAASEPAAAVLAAVRLLAGVDADVLHQLERAAQQLAADLADERRPASGRSVSPLLEHPVLADMLRQLKALRECLRADGAAERQSEQRLIESRTILLGMRVGGNVSVIVVTCGIFGQCGSFTFVF